MLHFLCILFFEPVCLSYDVCVHVYVFMCVCALCVHVYVNVYVNVCVLSLFSEHRFDRTMITQICNH